MGLLVLLLTAALPPDARAQAAAANELSVGLRSKIAAPIKIPVRKPISLNFKPRAEILKLRTQAVQAMAGLVEGTYSPSDEVFGKLRDKKPWWGNAGETVFGEGDKSITGTSEESRFILNPYMLVGVNSATLDIWDAKKLTQAELNSDSFPYYWHPDKMVWDPRKQRALVSFDISDYLNFIAKSGKLRAQVKPNGFGVVAYNARDFGYNWIHVDTANSRNVKNTQATNEPVEIRQYIHCGNTCGYPGGCNNMSPYTAELDRCMLTALPAQASVRLWKQRPKSVEQAPDFLVLLVFR